MNQFKSVENMTLEKDGKKSTISALCDEDGSFEITITGCGGQDHAWLSLQETANAIDPLRSACASWNKYQKH